MQLRKKTAITISQHQEWDKRTNMALDTTGTDTEAEIGADGTYLHGPNKGLTPDQADEVTAKRLAESYARTTEAMKDPAFGDQTLTEIREAKTPEDLAEILRLDPHSNYATWESINVALKPLLGIIFAFLTSSTAIGDRFHREHMQARQYRPTAESMARDMGIEPNSLETASLDIKDQFPSAAKERDSDFYRELGTPSMEVKNDI